MVLAAGALTLPAVPLSVAVLAGALAILNPRAFPLLPAYLACYAAAGARSLPRGPPAPSASSPRSGVPLLYGASAVTDALPYAGLLAGAALTAAAVVVVARGRLTPSLPVRLAPTPGTRGLRLRAAA